MPDAVDLFAGPGGLDLAAVSLGLDVVGVEWDRHACTTRAAAGLRTIRADVGDYPPERFAGVAGVIGSSPCPTFSSAGKKAGRALMSHLLAAVDAAAAGRDWSHHQAEAADELYADAMTPPPAPVDQLGMFDEPADLEDEPDQWTAPDPAAARAGAERDAAMSFLSVRVVDWVRVVDPEWVMLENVPAILPVWQAIARQLEARGYSTWAGVLTAECFGVAQTRARAFLMAHRSRTVGPPPATHQRFVSGEPAQYVEQVDGTVLEPWVSMAEALGWAPDEVEGADRPARTICGHRAPRWMYDDPDGTRGHQVRVGFGRKDDRGDSPDGLRERDFRDADEPALAITEKARSWVIDTDGQRSRDWDGRAAEFDAGERPARTLTGDARAWVVQHRRGGDRIEEGRRLDEAAECITSRVDRWQVKPDDEPPRGLHVDGANIRPRDRDLDQPAPALAFGHNAAGWKWAYDRPATALMGDPRVAQPGHHKDAANPDSPGRMEGAYRLEPWQALVLQSFPADYPVRGTRTAVFQQIGNAVPPLMARHVLAALLGLEP